MTAGRNGRRLQQLARGRSECRYRIAASPDEPQSLLEPGVAFPAHTFRGQPQVRPYDALFPPGDMACTHGRNERPALTHTIEAFMRLGTALPRQHQKIATDHSR